MFDAGIRSTLLVVCELNAPCNPGRYDGTVRNAGGHVVQFLYGEDGMDGTCIEEQKIDYLRLRPREFRVCLVPKPPLNLGYRHGAILLQAWCRSVSVCMRGAWDPVYAGTISPT